MKYTIFALLFFATFANARLPAAGANSTPSQNVKVADDEGLIDHICQRLIEGNVSQLNLDIQSGALGSKTRVRKVLKELGFPYFKGCIITLGNLTQEMKKKGIQDTGAEWKRIFALRDVEKISG